MFDPSSLDAKSKAAIIEAMRATRNNPIAMLKLHVLQQALSIKRWVETNHKSHQKEFALIYEAFQNKTAKLFDDFEAELTQRLTK